MTPIFFLLIYGIGCVLTLFRQPIFGLYTYLFTFYMSPADNWWGHEIPEIRYMFIVGIITLISTLFRSDESNRVSWLELPPSKILIGLVLYMWLQTWWAISPDIHIDGTLTFTKHVIIFYLIYRLLDTKVRIRNFLVAHIIGCCWFGYLALDASGGRLEKIGGPVGGSNELGAHLSTALIVGGIMWLLFHGWVRHLIFLCLPFIANTIILTVSRGAFLGLFTAGAVSGIFMPKGYRKKFLWLSCLAVILLALLAHDQLIDRFVETWESFTTEEVKIDSSAASRLDIFKAGINIGLDYPLGSGYRGTAILSPEYMDSKYLAKNSGQRSAHNTIAAVFAEHGFVGLFLYLALIIWVIKVLLKSRTMISIRVSAEDQALTVAISAALISMYVSGNFSNNLFTETQYWLLAVLCAHLAITVHKSDSPALSSAHFDTR